MALAAAMLGLSAVGAAALGSHLIPLQEQSVARLWNSALQMHLFHAAAMLGVIALAQRTFRVGMISAGLLLTFGTLLFSGSLYVRAAGYQWLPGWLAPLGGIMLCSGWFCLAAVLFRSVPPGKGRKP